MAVSRVTTYALVGVESRRVTVEADVSSGGFGAFSIVGLGDRAVREARERVRTAITNSGLAFPPTRVTVNLAPAHLRKEGPGFDLAIALAVLVASGQVLPGGLERRAVFGELALGGGLRPCRGALAVAEGARRDGFEGLVVATALGPEAALVDGLEVWGAGSLRDVVETLDGTGAAQVCHPSDGPSAAEPLVDGPDLADVRGHAVALRALEVAAAGGHNLLLSGPPGTGKTMLARRVGSILPPLDLAEAVEVTRIHSVAGLRLAAGGLVRERPFRAPHHSISASGLVGGGARPTPGEASLAHRGVLFLDELAEFVRPALEALRQPLEDGRVVVVRGQQAAVYPTQFMLVASTNPCPCGFLGTRRCRCTEADVARYRRRLSGPLLDRLDLLVDVQRPTTEELAAPPLTTSAEVRDRVAAARERAAARVAAVLGAPPPGGRDVGRPSGGGTAPVGEAIGAGTGSRSDAVAGAAAAHLAGGAAGAGAWRRQPALPTTAQLSPALLRRTADLAPAAQAVLRQAYDRGTLSPRGHDRVVRVARTVADLAASATIEPDHLLEAIALRQDADAAPDALRTA